MSAADFVRDLTAFSIQVTLVVLAVAVLIKVIPIPARVRYHGLRLALVAALLVPWLLRATDPPHDRADGLTQPSLTVRTPAQAVPGELPPIESFVAPEPGPSIPWVPVLLGLVGLGVACRGTWLAVGLMRLRRMTKTGRVVEEPEYAELQEQIGARATIAQVFGLAQPATFGVRRPVVMLPDALTAAPASLRRAVIVHELYHVRRRDWVFVLAEELVRTALWFHPAILWLTSHIQLAREEIVDELTVRATGDRRGYVQALLSFADSGGLSPAPAFAHRRQLFHRILGVSKEKVMSRPRIVISSVVVAAVVFAASWSASALFPIVKAGPVTLLPPASLIGVQNASLAAPVSLQTEDPFRTSAPARIPVALLDQQAGAAGTPRQVTPENPIPRRTRGVAPARPAQYANAAFQIALNMFVTLDRDGAVANVRRGGCAASEPGPGLERLEDACRAFFETSAVAIRQWRYDRPAQPPLEFNVVVSFRPGAAPDVLQSGAPIAVASSRDYAGPALIPDALANRTTNAVVRERQPAADATAEVVRAQLDEVTNRLRELERAFRIASERQEPAHPDLMKLRQQLAQASAEMETLRANLQVRGVSLDEQYSLAKRQFEEASNQLREVERQLAQSARQPQATVTVIPTPTTAFDGPNQLRSPSGRAPIRVGAGLSAPPRVIRSVKPEYTAEAMRARLQGTVQVEALIDEQGRVADARVLRSLPSLDEQALAAAKQWEFTPTLVNGEPVPVLLMLEIHFMLR